MRQFFKRLLLPLALVTVTHTCIVNAESIRAIGSVGGVQSSPQFNSNLRNNNEESLAVIGPTTKKDTLWSIATKIRPSSKVTVQQTLLAIYHLNPEAFENQNIHSLVPGSVLRIPSFAQVRSESTREAVKIMAAHKARLEKKQPSVSQPTTKAVSQPTTKAVTQQAEPKSVVVPNPVTTEVDEPASKSAPTSAPVSPEPVIKTPIQSTAVAKPISGSEIQVQEEKNPKLSLIIDKVQADVSGLKQEVADIQALVSGLKQEVADIKAQVSELKQELGDQSRIRSEVEKQLTQERMKREEIPHLAPSQLDQLLSNNWVVAGLALIPGLLIVLVVMMFLGRRSSSNQEQAQNVQDTPMNPAPASALAPQTLNESDEELILGDDLFSSMEDSEELFSEGDSKQADKPIDNDDDIFADLDNSDLDLDLDGEDDEDLYAAIDDSGDLDTNVGALSSSSNGISANVDDTAFGLEEVERALDQANRIEESDDVGFDLSDDGEMSQAEIESLLATDSGLEPLESPTFDQTMLDELLLQQESDEEDAEDVFDFDGLLDEGGTLASKEDRQPTEFELPTRLASDEVLDNLLADIEAQADSEPQQAIPDNKTAVDDSIFEEDHTALLDDYLIEELSGENSDDSEESSDERLEVFDELLDIEKSSYEESSSDLIHTETESPVDEKEPASELISSKSAEEPDVVVNSEIENSDTPQLNESQVIADDFDVPLGDDWVFDDLETEDEFNKSETLEPAEPLFAHIDLHDPEKSDVEIAPENAQTEIELPAQEDTITELDYFESSEFTEEDALADPELESDGEPVVESKEKSTAERELPELEDILAELGDYELPEYTEEDALADSEPGSDKEAVDSKVKSVVGDPELEDILAELGDIELPEYTEEDVLTDLDGLDCDEESVVSEVKPVAEEVQPELDDVFEEFDDLELPEYTEEDALADVETEIEDELAADSKTEEKVPTEKPSTEKEQANLAAVSKREFDQDALSDWLSEDDLSGLNFKLDKQVDAKVADSAGMDIDALLEMGRNDRNGFNLTPEQKASISDEVPESERDIWESENKVKESEVAEENWAAQDDVDDFDPASSKFMTIDNLMAQAERRGGDSFTPDDEGLKLDVGLNEFPDVIGDISDIDVDSDSEAASKLDLAKIYVEMNDDKGAIKLLEEAIVDGNDAIRQQARRLIDVININDRA